MGGHVFVIRFSQFINNDWAIWWNLSIVGTVIVYNKTKIIYINYLNIATKFYLNNLFKYCYNTTYFI